MSFEVLTTARHPRTSVDPFGILPCRHPSVLVHTTSGETLGDDMVECRRCGFVVPLFELYRGMTPPTPSKM